MLIISSSATSPSMTPASPQHDPFGSSIARTSQQHDFFGEPQTSFPQPSSPAKPVLPPQTQPDKDLFSFDDTPPQHTSPKVVPSPSLQPTSSPLVPPSPQLSRSTKTSHTLEPTMEDDLFGSSFSAAEPQVLK